MVEMAIMIIAGFLAGYWLGRKQGYNAGRTAGQNESPIIFRQQSYEQGYCILCHHGREAPQTSIEEREDE